MGHLMEVTTYCLLLRLLRIVATNQDIDTTESEDFFQHTSHNPPIEYVDTAGNFWNCQVSEILGQHLVSELDKAVP